MALTFGCLLPDSSEVRRTRVLDASQGEVLAQLQLLPTGPAWSDWSPSHTAGGLVQTSCLPERGIWFDVRTDPPRKAAILFESQPEGLRLTWFEVSQWSGNPLGRIVAWSREAQRAKELEASLVGLDQILAENTAQDSEPDPPKVLLIIL